MYARGGAGGLVRTDSQIRRRDEDLTQEDGADGLGELVAKLDHGRRPRAAQPASPRGSSPFPNVKLAPTAPTTAVLRVSPMISRRRYVASIPVQCAPNRYATPSSRSLPAVQATCASVAANRWRPPITACTGAGRRNDRAYSAVLTTPACPHPVMIIKPSFVSTTTEASSGIESSAGPSGPCSSNPFGQLRS